ncbi:hypothetical protein H2200_002780 [Cladophialophora chaetospira]|uniref:Ankyrin n=1 Tax=Cladophialophora chaetospira TaxID=386627 RepID=A0AA38XKB6_9EURO|nr:hypothetical protein H2200_002780 [Cladophialophora chaetospira]
MQKVEAKIQNWTRPAMLKGLHIRLKVRLPRQLILHLPWYEICDQLEVIFSSTISTRKNRSPSLLPTRLAQDQIHFPDWETLESQDGPYGSLCMEDYIHYIDEDSDNSAIHGLLSGVAQESDVQIGVNIASALDLPAWLSQSAALTKTTAKMAPYVPERFLDEVKASVKELLDPTSTMRMQALTSFMALMLANSLLLPLEVDAFLACLDEVAGDFAFDVLAPGKDPSTRAIVSELLFSAVRLNKLRLVRSALRNGVDVDLRSSGGDAKTLLREAIDHARPEIVRLLTEAGATITTGIREVPPYHYRSCPANNSSDDNSFSCSSSCYEENPTFYCPCEDTYLSGVSDIGSAAISRLVDDLIPLLLGLQPHAGTGLVLTAAIASGARYETVKVLLEAGASTNECCPYSSARELFPIDVMERPECPLSAAIDRGDSDMLRLLLKNGANPNVPITIRNETIMHHWGEYLFKSPLVLAAESGSLDLVEILLRYGADPNWSTIDILRQPEKKKLTAKVLSRRAVRVKNMVQILVFFPLQAAASLTSPKIAEALLDHGATANPGQVDLLLGSNALRNPMIADDFGITPIEGAVLSGSHELVKRLISAGADPNQCSFGGGGRTPLQRASEIGSASMFEALLDAGATINSSTVPDHKTKLLPGFVRSRHHDMTMKLLQQGADADGDELDELSPLNAAIESRDLGLVSLLLDWGADPNKMCSMLPDESLYPLELGCDDNFVLRMWERGSMVPPLHNAIIAGVPSIVAYLCESGSDVNKTNSERPGHEAIALPHLATALHVAVLYERRNLVELLLTRRARINWPRRREPHIIESPLSVAVKTCNRDIAELLIRYGADPNDGYIESNRADEGEPIHMYAYKPLMEEACFRKDCRMVRLLISSGANPLVGFPLIALFTFHHWEYDADAESIGQRAEIMDLLVERGVKVNRRSAYEHSALQNSIVTAGFFAQAVETQQQILRCARRLIDLGADVNAAPPMGNVHSPRSRTALAAAAETGDVDLVQYLLSKGAEVNTPAGPLYGATALQAAAFYGYLRIAQILLEHGAEIDAEPSPQGGWRAIEGAAMMGRIDMVKFLLDNYNGKRSMSELLASAMKDAKKWNQWYVWKLLEQYKPPEPGAETICSASFDQAGWTIEAALRSGRTS